MGARAVVTAAGDAQAVGALLALGVLAASEATFGRTPGKAMMRLETRRADGGPVGWRAAAIRRSWMALYGLGLIPGIPIGIGAIFFLAALLSVVGSSGRSADDRGWHDRLAGTEVVTASARRRPRPSLVAGGIGIGVLIFVAGWWFQTPAEGSSSFHGLSDADQIDCHLVHDGWLYPRHERTIVLTRGGDGFTGRFGPHDVTLIFVPESSRYGNPGLEMRIATRSLVFTSGSSTGTSDRTVNVTTGPGLGNLTVTCEPG